jgi:hypothetical protein
MDTRNIINLAEGVSQNGDYSSSGAVPGGEYQIVIEGLPDGGTVALKSGRSSGAVTAHSDGSFTADTSEKTINLGKGVHLIATISGIENSPANSVYVQLHPIRKWS